MTEAILSGQQVLIMFFFMAIGYVCIKSKLLPRSMGDDISIFVINILLPFMMLSTFNSAKLTAPIDLFLTAVVTLLAHVVSLGAALLFFRKNEKHDYPAERFGVTFSNSGFMGIPLAQALYGEAGVLYTAIYLGVFNLLLWSLGMYLLGGKKEVNVKKMFLNPAVLSIILGIILYLFNIKFPPLVETAVSGVAVMYTPLAMISVGMFLTDIPVISLFKNPRNYLASFVKLLIVPIGFILLAAATNMTNWFGRGDVGRIIVLTVILTSACPASVSMVQFCSKMKRDTSYPAQMISLSTLFSVLTIPLSSLLSILILS